MPGDQVSAILCVPRALEGPFITVKPELLLDQIGLKWRYIRL